jgi:hypothetical protein
MFLQIVYSDLLFTQCHTAEDRNRSMCVGVSGIQVLVAHYQPFDFYVLGLS